MGGGQNILSPPYIFEWVGGPIPLYPIYPILMTIIGELKFLFGYVLQEYLFGSGSCFAEYKRLGSARLGSASITKVSARHQQSRHHLYHQ